MSGGFFEMNNNKCFWSKCHRCKTEYNVLWRNGKILIYMINTRNDLPKIRPSGCSGLIKKSSSQFCSTRETEPEIFWWFISKPIMPNKFWIFHAIMMNKKQIKTCSGPVFDSYRFGFRFAAVMSVAFVWISSLERFLGFFICSNLISLSAI